MPIDVAAYEAVCGFTVQNEDLNITRKFRGNQFS